MRAQTQWRTFLRESPAYPPEAFEGQGIVILAGGLTYMVPAWVNIQMLRRTGAILDYVVCDLGQHPHAAQKRGCTIIFRMFFCVCRLMLCSRCSAVVHDQSMHT